VRPASDHLFVYRSSLLADLSIDDSCDSLSRTSWLVTVSGFQGSVASRNIPIALGFSSLRLAEVFGGKGVLYAHRKHLSIPVLKEIFVVSRNPSQQNNAFRFIFGRRSGERRRSRRDDLPQQSLPVDAFQCHASRFLSREREKILAPCGKIYNTSDAISPMIRCSWSLVRTFAFRPVSPCPQPHRCRCHRPRSVAPNHRFSLRLGRSSAALRRWT